MIKLTGIPFDENSSFLKGTALAPGCIRLMEKSGASNAYSESGLEITNGVTYEDSGDLQFEDSDPVKAFEIIRQNISRQLSVGSKIISLGGDHSITFPVISAYAAVYKPLHVLHIDAHADLYDAFDDNPYSHASPFARIMERGLIASLTQIGIRTLNTHQRQQAEKFGVRIVEAKNLNFDFIAKLEGPLYISIDLDALDPAFAPGVSHHEPGGLSVRDVISTFQKIDVEVVGGDIVEYNPVRDIHNMTAMVAYKLMKEMMSCMIR